MLDQPEMERDAAETLRSLSVRTMKSVRQKVSSLSGGQRQTVAIARAVLQKAKLVILDEPTAALGVAQTEQVLPLVRRLADSGRRACSSSATTSPTCSRWPTTSTCSTSGQMVAPARREADHLRRGRRLHHRHQDPGPAVGDGARDERGEADDPGTSAADPRPPPLSRRGAIATGHEGTLADQFHGYFSGSAPARWASCRPSPACSCSASCSRPSARSSSPTRTSRTC